MQRRQSYLAFDLPVLVFVACAVWHLTLKPGLPEEFAFAGEPTINGTALRDANEVEFFLSQFRVHDKVAVGPAASVSPVTVSLQPQSTLLVIFDAFVACVIIGVGMFVYIRRPEEKAARVFHAASLLTAMAIAGSKTIFWLKPAALGTVLCGVFFLIYTILPVLFLHFTFVFPSVRWPRYRRLLPGLYVAAVLISAWSGMQYVRAADPVSMILYRRFVISSMVQNAFAVVLFLGGIANFVSAYIRTPESGERKKIRWLLYGLSIGPAPFILLWSLPEALGSSPLIPEWMFQLVLLLIPATFAISILKYRLMDIDVLINRSVVYAIVVGAGVVVYLLVLLAATRMVIAFTPGQSLVVATVAAALLALAFEPAKRRVQHYVDRRFFRVQYNFRQALRQVTEEMRRCFDVAQIADVLVRRVDALMALDRTGFFTLEKSGFRLQLGAHRGFDLLAKHGVRFEAQKLHSSLNLPVALDASVEPGVEHESGNHAVFRRWGMALVLPLLSEQKEILGFLVLGEKKSGLRFSVEDADLLGAMVTQAGLAMERISLQSNLLLQHAETERLEELSRLKSYFVSSVSHDLKTPLTSIRMFAEILRQRKETSTGEAGEYLEIIEGESDRLTRLINNVLDFASIERGVKQYRFRESDLNEIVERALTPLQYQLKMGSFRLEVTLAPEVITLQADPDAITEAVVNLLSNAMKYAGERKEIAVATFLRGDFAAVSIADRGIGISVEELPHIFEPFRRAGGARALGVGGTGLGLALVKDIVEAHGGRIELQSQPGQGSTFVLLLPLTGAGLRRSPEPSKSDETHPDH